MEQTTVVNLILNLVTTLCISYMIRKAWQIATEYHRARIYADRLENLAAPHFLHPAERLAHHALSYQAWIDTLALQVQHPTIQFGRLYRLRPKYRATARVLQDQMGELLLDDND